MGVDIGGACLGRGGYRGDGRSLRRGGRRLVYGVGD